MDSRRRLLEAQNALARNDLADAERLAGEVLAAHPQVPLALNVIGQVLLHRNQVDPAAAVLDMATRLGPMLPEPWASLGEVHWRRGQFDQTAACLRRAVDADGRQPALWINYGIALGRIDRHADAAEALQRGLRGLPDHAEGQIALATSFFSMGDAARAIETLRAAARRCPDNAKVFGNLGVLYDKTDRLEEAVGMYDRALALTPGPGDPQFLFNRGSSFIQQLRIDEARQDWEKATALAPDYAEAWMNLAILEMLDGNLPKGFKLFEWRWQLRHRHFPLPCQEWDGSPLDGRRLILFMEQGLGDMLQFCRYVPILKAMYDVRITLLALPELHRLLATLPGVDGIYPIAPPYPPADTQCSIMSLPRLLKTTLDTIPGQVGYLAADPVLVEQWGRRLAHLGPGKKVGLYWQGTQVDTNRIVRLKDLSPFWDVKAASPKPGPFGAGSASPAESTNGNPPIHFISLQKGPGQEEVAGFDRPLLNLGPEINDFADTAAVMAHLDLMISIDTAACHLAGALARPTWTLLPYRPDWRWLLGRNDSPWYPTMRLYRQQRRRDWSAVIDRLGADLSAWLAEP